MTDATFGAALARLWPRAPRAKVTAIAAVAPHVFQELGLNSPQLQAHCMAQISHENSAGTIVRENMSYTTPGRILAVFGVDHHSAGVTPEEAEQLVRNPEALAERVYGLGNPKKARELGNTQPGDGFRYRGNGDLGLTGRDAHRRVGELTGHDLENDPEQLEDYATSFRVAVTEFVALGCLEPAAADDAIGVRRLVNGGSKRVPVSKLNGVDECKVWLRRWKDALEGVEEPPKRPRAAPQEQGKPITQSTIIKGGVVGAVLSTAEVARQASQTASEVTSAAKDAAENASAVGTLLHPFLSSASLPWLLLSTVIVGAFAYVAWQRWTKLRDEGV
jgi:putative chitinase